MSRLGDWVRRTFTRDVTEAAPVQQAPATTPRQGYETGIPVGGLTEQTVKSQGSGASDRQTLLTDLYDAYLACPWAWTATNAIARTITGGGIGFRWDRDDGEGDKEKPAKPLPVLQCERLLTFCNPREDVIQLLRSTVTDLEVFGDAYIEVVWAGGIPVALYTLDCPSTSPIADAHGNITGYLQSTEQGQEARFEPHEVIHISLDAPRSGIFGVSPTYAALLPIKIWLFTSATLKEIFRKGMPPNLWVDHPQGMNPTEQGKWIDQHMTRNVGPMNIGRPVVTKGGATVKELQQSQIDAILHVLDQQRDVILSSYGVPPAEAGVIESGNIGGGTGETQRKTFEINTCAPIGTLILEKLNFLLTRAFGIEGWSLRFNPVDMRDSKVIEEIRDTRLRNGSWTLDRYRAEIGEPPVDGGDHPVLVDRQNLVQWQDMGAASKAGIAAKLRGTALEPAGEPGQPTGTEAPISLQKPPEAAPGTRGSGPGADPVLSGVAPVGPGGDMPGGEAWSPRNLLGESWSTYSARIRQALAELPDDRDTAA